MDPLTSRQEGTVFGVTDLSLKGPELLPSFTPSTFYPPVVYGSFVSLGEGRMYDKETLIL